jgi:glucosyl-3-phosphoglycerate synthase
MSDFHQTGEITTLHALKRNGQAQLEWELQSYSRSRPIALVLPALFAEFQGAAMRRICEELEQARYLRQIVVALDRANEDQLAEARAFFDGFSQQVDFLWISGPRVQRLFHLLRDSELLPGESGKGRSCWLALGYVLASGWCDVVVMHDCDILSYDRRLLARLCYPVVNPGLRYELAKGYYARFTDHLHGRVTRLFVTPVLRALLTLLPGQPLLQYLDSFRYALAGEVAMRTSLAGALRVPANWGMEIGMLAEAHRRLPASRICQVDVADNYEHKHQPLSEDDPSQGLARMSFDIARTLFWSLAAEGVVFTEPMARTLELLYLRMAEDAIARHSADARLNGLEYDPHLEERAVAVFARGLRPAAVCCPDDPRSRSLPNWDQVLAALPNFFHLLLEAVAADNQVRELQPA